MFVWDIERSTNVRLTSEGSGDAYPVWTADGRHLFFGRGGGRPGVSLLSRQAADGSGEPTLIWEGVDARPQSLSPDGRVLVYGRYGDGRQLFFRPLAGGDPRPVVADPVVNALNGELSPDGRWIACPDYGTVSHCHPE